jgi:hypothetical protein
VSERTRWFLAVGVIGSAFIILAVTAAYSGVVNFSKSIDEPNQSLWAGTFLPLAMGAVMFGLATYKTFTGRLFAGQRWNRIDKDLHAAGFRDATEREIEATAKIHVQLLAPNVLAVDRGGGIDHVALGPIAGREFRSFRARIRGGGRWIDVPVVAVRVPASFAPTIIRPAKRGMRVQTTMKQVLFEYERFNRSIEVRSDDRYFATALVDARMMEWLSAHLRRTTIELADGWGVAWSTSLIGSPRSPQQLIDLLRRFDEQIPRVIPSLFPRRNRHTEWIHKRKHAGFSRWLERLTDVGTERTPRR